MNYAELRQEIKSGDAILVQGKSTVSRLIRAATGGSVSHVGSALWLGQNNVYMPEQREWKAFQIGRLSARLKTDMKNCGVYLGRAPKQVRDWIDENHDEYVDNVLATQNEPYGYFELPRVLWAQWTEKDVNPKRLVCSTWLQRQWEASGWTYGQSMDPSDYLDACESVTALDLREFYE